MSLRITVAKWLPLAVTIIGLGLIMYFGVQQLYRTGLNDPQIQITGDVANALRSGARPADVVPRYVFDVAQSLAPFVAMYDNAHQPLESSGALSGAPPQPPAGIFDEAKSKGENRVTWQPNSSMRIALVVRYVKEKDEYVVSGRNMMEVESRIGNFTFGWLLGLILILAATLGLEVFGAWRHENAMKKMAPKPQS